MKTFVDQILDLPDKRFMKKWSRRNKFGGHHSKLIKKIFEILKYISGDDTSSLLDELTKKKR